MAYSCSTGPNYIGNMCHKPTFKKFFQFNPSAEVSGEVAHATFSDTSTERNVVFLSDNHTSSE